MDTIKTVFLRLRKVINPLSAKFLMGLVLSSLLVFSCKKDTSDIGLDLLQGDQLQAVFTDTVTVITHTKKVDSLKTSFVTLLLCGNYYDPVFGITNASFYSEIRPTSFGAVSFGPNPIIDSVVLSLVYKSYYGVPAPLEFKVFEATQRIYKDSVYTSDTTLTYNSLFPLGDVVVEPNTIDSVHADGQTYGPQLRIKLDRSLLQGLLTTSIYADAETFRNIFNGIFVMAKQTNLSGNRAIYSFIAKDSKVRMYYHDQSTPSTLVTYDYQMGGSETGRFNHFDHDYSMADPSIDLQLNSADNIQEDMVYVQGLSGLQVKIGLPYIDQLKKAGPVAINKAELIFKADPSIITSFLSAPTAMVIVGLDSNGSYSLTPDLLEGGAYSGGTYDATNHEYHFNIARYIQQVLTGKIVDHGLMLIATNSSFYANRVMVGGGGVNSPFRLKLNLTYTKI